MKNIFGTDGIRNKVGSHPFTIDALQEFGKACGQWAVNIYGKNVRILLANDTRLSCDWVKSAFKSGLLLHPVIVYDSHVLPTPAVLQTLQDSDTFDLGIVVTASHNPYHDNGIKFLDKQGKLSAIHEKQITELFYLQENSPQYDSFGSDVPVYSLQKQYIESILKYCRPDLKGKTVVLDCANGATSHIAPYVFNACGAHTIVIGNTPNGKNINNNCGASYISTLQKVVLENKANIGFAFDGDGDRIIAIDNNGNIKDGDDILALLNQHPTYAKQKTIVGTIMSNQGLETHFNNHGKKLIRTDVGDKHITRYLKEHNLLLGAEPSGHIILLDYLPVCDGIVTALKILESIKHNDNWDMHTFKKYPQVLISVPATNKKDLSEKPLSDLIAASEIQLQSGRILVRYSGTEALVRVMTEAPNLQMAQTVAEQLSKELSKILTS